MAGNVWEWVADWYSADYYATLSTNTHNPLGPTFGDERVIRGGAWNSRGGTLRVAYRHGFNPLFS